MDTQHTNQPEQACRPLDHLAAVGWLYPEAWRQIDRFINSKGKNGLPDWPEWCFLPMEAFYAIISQEAGVVRLPPHLLPDVARLAAVGTWRYTQGIYRFDPDVCDAVMSAGISSGVSCEALYRLPEWCVYIETPGKEWGGMPLHGFFAHMEYDTEKGTATLRLLLDCEEGLFSFPVRLGADALDGAVSQATEAAHVQATGGGRFSGTPPEDAGADLAGSLEPLVSMVLYLCGEDGDIGGQGDATPGKPKRKRTQEEGRLFRADAHFGYALETPRRRDVGVRTGVALWHAWVLDWEE